MEDAKAEKRARLLRKLLWRLDDLFNLTMLCLFLVLLAFGIYCFWDTRQVNESADSVKYEVYKPDTEDSLSFEELQSMNEDVFGWITIYGTAVDYPLVQGEDNLVYLNQDATGAYSVSGSIFLDSRNAADLSDYNSIIHGHHMDASAMFGDLSKFDEEEFFDSHRYGNLYANGRNYGLVFFEYAVVDAYDDVVYTPAVEGRQEQAELLTQLEEKAQYLRQEQQEQAEHLIILSTCNASVTNGRSILVAYLTDETYEDTFYEEPKEKTVFKGLEEIAGRSLTTLPLWLILCIILALMILIRLVWDVISVHLRRKKARREAEEPICENPGERSGGNEQFERNTGKTESDGTAAP
jgi:sortase B